MFLGFAGETYSCQSSRNSKTKVIKIENRTDEMYKERKLGDKVVKITSIEYCELRVGNPHMVDVEVIEDGRKPYTKTYDAVLNHEFDVATGRFEKRTAHDGTPFDYKNSVAFETPVIHVIPNGEISKFVREEFERRFQEQRQEEDW